MNEAMKKKQMKIFFLITFGVSYLMGIGLYYAKVKGLNASIFPMFQMFTPALGTIVALMVTRKGEGVLPEKFFIGFITISFLFMLLAIGSVVYPSLNYGLWANIAMILGSIILWICYFLDKKERRIGVNLNCPNKKKTLFMVVIFFILYLGRTWIMSALSGEEMWGNFNLQRLILGLLLIPQFFIMFGPFFGEEYGWRYYLQPILQKKYGMVKGVLLLGLIWGIWHLPLNLFYYSAQGTGIISLANQIIVCISMSIFMAFAYNYTGSIWAPVWMHYINNNYLLLFVEKIDPSILENNEFTWNMVLFTLVGSLVFLPFIWSKWLKGREYRLATANERLEAEEEKNEEGFENRD